VRETQAKATSPERSYPSERRWWISSATFFPERNLPPKTGPMQQAPLCRRRWKGELHPGHYGNSPLHRNILKIPNAPISVKSGLMVPGWLFAPFTISLLKKIPPSGRDKKGSENRVLTPLLAAEKFA
jgi:hypothetical protein